ncbi:malto-oligosyltrehalose trehalohydrolase [Enterobacteriaceae bacterium G50]|nr:malto-oligosyltrehalose trehalohydrolase [Enterobacteriaceae bacterium G50]
MEFITNQRHWGAEFISDTKVRFRIWAEGQQTLSLLVDGQHFSMVRSADGWFQLELDNLVHGMEYQYLLSDGTTLPDPASKAQKGDINSPSLLINPSKFQLDNVAWQGLPWEKSIIYEMHIGTFTPEGTFRSAIQKLPYLAELGVTQLEIMPVAQFGGSRGWGYDGVLLYAPHSAYGSPQDFLAFIDAAHGLGLSVILDIVLNHFGPEGNYLPVLSPEFFCEERTTPWGNAIAYENKSVRQYILEAPLYWLSEYHLDGLRFDAIDQINDVSVKHILTEIAEEIRKTIPDRYIHLTTEDSRNIVSLHPRDEQGNTPHFTAEWNDDFHNAAHVFATGESHAYYQDFIENPERHLAKALTQGFAYQGEISHFSGQPRGVKSSDQPMQFFVDFIQNHDQIGNRAQGERLITLAGTANTKILLAMLLLSPHIPLLFMGEEYGETNPFLFFTDFHGCLAKAVREGRAREFAGHAGHDNDVPDPNDINTFQRSKIDWQKVATDEGKTWLRFTRHLIQLRHEHIVPLLMTNCQVETEVINTAPGIISVQWHFEKVTLSLSLNISSAAFSLPDLPGKTLFQWPEVQHPLAAQSILVRLANGDASS